MARPRNKPQIIWSANVPMVEKENRGYTNVKGSLELPNGQVLLIELSDDTKGSTTKQGNTIRAWLRCAAIKKDAGNNRR